MNKQAIQARAKITGVFRERSDMKTLTFRLQENALQDGLDVRPGQFIQISRNGIGGVPISVSSPLSEGEAELCVERRGRLMSSLFEIEEGSRVLIRGPFGNGFPVGRVRDNDILFVAGGNGMVPLRSAVEYIYEFREEYKDIQIIYGDKKPTSLLFRRHFPRWKRYFDLNVACEETAPEGEGERGSITDLINKVNLNIENSVIFACGPPIMYKFILPKLQEIGFAERNIYLSFEECMRDIEGCGHCNIKPKFIRDEGPIFSLVKVKEYLKGFC